MKEIQTHLLVVLTIEKNKIKKKNLSNYKKPSLTNHTDLQKVQ